MNQVSVTDYVGRHCNRLAGTRQAVTGILSGSLQKVTLDRILRLIEAIGLTVETRVRKAA